MVQNEEFQYNIFMCVFSVLGSYSTPITIFCPSQHFLKSVVNFLDFILIDLVYFFYPSHIQHPNYSFPFLPSPKLSLLPQIHLPSISQASQGNQPNAA